MRAAVASRSTRCPMPASSGDLARFRAPDQPGQVARGRCRSLPQCQVVPGNQEPEAWPPAHLAVEFVVNVTRPDVGLEEMRRFSADSCLWECSDPECSHRWTARLYSRRHESAEKRRISSKPTSGREIGRAHV